MTQNEVSEAKKFIDKQKADFDELKAANEKLTEFNGEMYIENEELIKKVQSLESRLQASQPKHIQYLGANGHPYTQQAYRGNLWQQADLIRGMGMNAERVDIVTDENGKIKDDFNIMADWLLSRGDIEKFPMVSPRWNRDAVTSAELKANYDKGYKQYKGFGTTVKHTVTHVEVGNETYFEDFITKDPSGEKLSDYNVQRLTAKAWFFKGAEEALHELGLKVIINAAWTHFAFIQFLIDFGVIFDVISWHWYDNMESERLKKTKEPIEDTLTRLFPNHVIFFNEVGYRFRTANDTQQTAVDKAMPYIRRIFSKGYSIFVHELLKQPKLSTTAIDEKNYGIFIDVNTPTLMVEELRRMGNGR